MRVAYLVYPKGYDPVVASGCPKEFGFPETEWSEEDTKKMKELEKEAILSYIEPKDQWSQEVETFEEGEEVK